MNNADDRERFRSLDVELSGVRQSVALVVGIAFVSWASIALVFWAGETAAGGTGGSGAGGAALVLSAAWWVAILAAVTLAVTGALVLALWTWVALAPLFGAPRRAPQRAAGALERAQHAAVAEAEELLRPRGG